MASPTLLGLPVEVRLMIITYATGHPGHPVSDHHYPLYGNWYAHQAYPLLLTSRAIRTRRAPI